MAKKPLTKRNGAQLKKLNFLIGKWHTSGEILHGASASAKAIRGMDTYEWVPGEFFLLHRVDVFMGKERVEAIEIIGYDEKSRSYFMRSFDNQGASSTMFATLEKPGVLKFGDTRMKAVLKANRNGSSMSAKWELSENGKRWKPWMNMRFEK